MKAEDFENYTDPIFEGGYRMKEELSARFNSVEALSAYMRKIQEECRSERYESCFVLCATRRARIRKRIGVRKHNVIWQNAF